MSSNITCFAFAAVILFAVPQPSVGQGFLDDFDSDSVMTDTGIEVNWLPLKPFEAGSRMVRDGAYVIEPAEVPNQLFNYAESDSVADRILVKDATFHTSVNVSGESRDYIFGIAARGRFDEAVDSQAGLFTTMNHDGRISIGAYDLAAGVDIRSVAVVDLIPHQTKIEMEFEVIDDIAALTVWEAGTEYPDWPQLELPIPESLLIPGNVVIWAGNRVTQGPMFAAFDSFELTPHLEPIVGDYNGDRIVSIADIDIMQLGGRSFDLTGDGVADENDRDVMVHELVKTWYGDSDGDSQFNSADLVAVFETGLYETGMAARWAEGNWNLDGTFGTGDLVTAFADGGYEQGPFAAVNAVPEPSSLVMIAIGLLGLLKFRSRHRI